MISLQTLALFLLTLTLALCCGYGLVRFLLPEEFREHRYILMPVVGYSVFCWLTFTISGTFHATVSKTAWLSFSTLAVLTLLAVWRYRYEDTWIDLRDGLRTILLLSATMLVVILWPLFFVGADTYLGSVNPDYTFALKDSFFLKHKTAVSLGYNEPIDSYAPFVSSSDRPSIHARYIGHLFGILLENALSVPARTGLTLSIALWMFCIPHSIYVMTRIIFQQARPVACLSAALTGVSGSVAMSFHFFFVGQNSALALTPLVLTVLYILVTQYSLGILSLAGLLSCALFWMYPVLLPYAFLPGVVLILSELRCGRLKIQRAVHIGVGLLLFFLLTTAGIVGYLQAYFADWQALSNKLDTANVFLEFLTEQFFPTFFGVVTYSMSSSFLRGLLGPGLPVILYILVLWITAGLLVTFLAWVRSIPDKRPVIIVSSGVAMTGLAWWFNTFRLHYGYALLKMASWAQFLVLPLAAYGIFRLWSVNIVGVLGRRGVLYRGLLMAVALVYIGGNILTSLDYGIRSLGQPGPRVTTVNLVGITGNPDYLELEKVIPRLLSPGESVGLALTDSIQNEWVSYYLRNIRVSILSHLYLPFSEENLDAEVPGHGVHRGGDAAADDNPYFHGATDDYYLTVNRNDWNNDIIEQELPRPIWRNHTFQLVRADQTHDLLVTGRGFYRIEHSVGRDGYWWPEVFRWSPGISEFFLLRAKSKGQPYRLCFTGISGYGLEDARRTIELWHNGTKFDERVINGSGRIVSAPFVPAGDVERLVLRVKEEVRPLRRRFALWNREIPEDYRRLNFAISSVQLLGPGVWPPAVVLDRPISGGDMFRKASAFNGVEVDSWIRDRAILSFVRPTGSASVVLKVLVPDRSDYDFPYTILVQVGDVRRVVDVSRPGVVPINVPLPLANEPQLCTLEIEPSQHFVPTNYKQEMRPLTQSVRIESLMFRALNPEGSELLSLGRLRVSGVDSDGWMRREANLTIGERSDAGGVQIEVEFPEWAKVKECSISVLRNERRVFLKKLRPGYHLLYVPLSVRRGSTRLTIRADKVFRLPSPDTRLASLRIRSVRLTKRVSAVGASQDWPATSLGGWMKEGRGAEGLEQ